MGFQDFGGGINKLQYFGVNLEYLLILFAVSTSLDDDCTMLWPKPVPWVRYSKFVIGLR